MISSNEAKLMNEENWIEITTNMRKDLKKLMKKIAKQEKKRSLDQKCRRQ